MKQRTLWALVAALAGIAACTASFWVAWHRTAPPERTQSPPVAAPAYDPRSAESAASLDLAITAGPTVPIPTDDHARLLRLREALGATAQRPEAWADFLFVAESAEPHLSTVFAGDFLATGQLQGLLPASPILHERIRTLIANQASSPFATKRAICLALIEAFGWQQDPFLASFHVALASDQDPVVLRQARRILARPKPGK